MNMKTQMEIFKKHGAHYYEDDEQSIIDAMTEYAEQQVKNSNIPLVSKSAKPKSKIKVDDPNAPWNWKKDSSEY